MNETLKPCPFCGGEAEITHSQWYDSDEPSNLHHVWSVGCAKRATHEYCCPGRLCMNRGWKDRDDAIAVWNTRIWDEREHRELMDAETIRGQQEHIARLERQLADRDRHLAAKVDEAKATNAENARLRDLIRDMWHDGMCECDERDDCATCEYGYLDRMRGLGIGVGA